MARRRRTAVGTQLLLVGGFVALLLLGLASLTFLVVEEQVSADFVEGVHYVRLDEPRRIRGRLPLVEEFFSYTCVHCYNLDDALDAWAAARDGEMRLERVPAVGSVGWRRLGAAYYAASELQLLDALHKRFFRATHDARRDLSRRDELKQFLGTLGLDAERFIETLDSPEVAGRLASADSRQRQYRVQSVPSLVVNGTWLVRAGREVSLTRMLDVADHLLQLETDAPETDTAETEATETEATETDAE